MLVVFHGCMVLKYQGIGWNKSGQNIKEKLTNYFIKQHDTSSNIIVKYILDCSFNILLLAKNALKLMHLQRTYTHAYFVQVVPLPCTRSCVSM